MNISDSRAVLRYAERPYTTCSFRVMRVSTQYGLSERDCDVCLEPYLTIRISHPALEQKIEISDSRAVVRYVQRPYTTCSFRVMSKYAQNVVSERGFDACSDS